MNPEEWPGLGGDRICHSRFANIQCVTALKPQDVYVVLRILVDSSRRAPYAELAGKLG
jgi:hypothetical protein